MTGRERVMASLNFRQPDRVPLDFNGHRSSGISVQAYRKLRKYLDLPPGPLYVYDVVQQMALVERDVLDLFDVDVIQLGCDFDQRPNYWRDWALQDGTPCKVPGVVELRRVPNGQAIFNRGRMIATQPAGCHYFEQSVFPLADSEAAITSALVENALADIMWTAVPCPPMPLDYKTPEGERALRNIAAATRAGTDRAVYAIFGGNLVETGQFTFRIDNFLCELLDDPDRLHTYLDILTERHMDNLAAYLDAVGDHIDVIGFGDDMGTQNGPQFSPEVYMEFFYPREKRMWSYVHDRFPELKICLHCCGGVRPLLPLLVEAGLDAINPVQFVSREMELEALNRDFAGKLGLWGGGCDTRRVLPGGTPAEVREHVRHNLDILQPGGGFVFQQVHNILDDVPPENIVSMFKTVREYC